MELLATKNDPDFRKKVRVDRVRKMLASKDNPFVMQHNHRTNTKEVIKDQKGEEKVPGWDWIQHDKLK